MMRLLQEPLRQPGCDGSVALVDPLDLRGAALGLAGQDDEGHADQRENGQQRQHHQQQHAAATEWMR